MTPMTRQRGGVVFGQNRGGMNLAVRGIDADIRWNNEGSFHKDELQDLKADFILANPPFNISDWGGDRLRDDARWKFGVPRRPFSRISAPYRRSQTPSRPEKRWCQGHN